MALFAWPSTFIASLLGFLLAAFASRACHLYPHHLDSAVFGPMGPLAFTHALAFAGGGGVAPALCGLWPIDPAGVDALPRVPSAAPLHVGALLGAGFLDFSTDANWALSPGLSLAALALGGL